MIRTVAQSSGFSDVWRWKEVIKKWELTRFSQIKYPPIFSVNGGTLGPILSLYFRPTAPPGLIIITISCLLSAIIQRIKEVIQSRMSIFQILHLACSRVSLWCNSGITYLERKTNDLIISFLPQIFMVNICGELVPHNVMHHFSCRQATPPAHISTYFHTELYYG